MKQVLDKNRFEGVVIAGREIVSMPIVKAVCPKCSAPIDVDDAEDAAICPHCNNAFIVKQAVRAYRAEQATLKAEPVPESRQKGFVIENGVLKQYVGLDTDVTVPAGATAIGKDAFAQFRELRSVKLPESVTEVQNGAFAGCTGLVSVTIPDSVTSIGADAFSGCSGLISVVIPDSVTRIGTHAFYGCTGLKSLTIPDSVTSIGDHAFADCTGLTSVTIPDSITSIEARAFSYCSGLTNVTIPGSVISIGSAAFSYCTGLTNVTLCSAQTPFGLKCLSEYDIDPLHIKVPLQTFTAPEEWVGTHRKDWNEIQDLIKKNQAKFSSNNTGITTTDGAENRVIICPSCGKPVKPGWKFCMECGAAIINRF